MTDYGASPIRTQPLSGAEQSLPASLPDASAGETKLPSEVVTDSTPTEPKRTSPAVVMVSEGSSHDNAARPHAAPDSPTVQNFPPERRSTSQTTPSGSYVVTAGTFVSNEIAQRLKSRFAARGKKVQITMRISDSQELYVVSVIGFQPVEAAQVERQRLTADFPECYIATIDTPTTRPPH